MKISENGIKLIKDFEGCELTSYWDSIGRCYTIGYGHTSSVKKGMKITQDQAIQLLKDDLRYFEVGVESVVKTPCNQNQFDSLVSFAFNCGLYALKTSTLLQKMLSYDYKGASNEFLRWCKDGNGNIIEGLLRRRKAEKELFDKSVIVYGENSICYFQKLLNEYGYKDKNKCILKEDGILGDLTLSACPCLCIGCNSVVVKWLQRKLCVEDDGFFGEITRNSVMCFQKQRGLKVDGIVGKNTWKELLK